ncbi:MAG TPA: cellulase family glycosylhydrolase [Methanocella sp.]
MDSPARASTVSSVSGSRLATLQKGVNFYEWFTNSGGQYQPTISDGDLQLIHGTGARYIRLQINLPDIYNSASPGSPNGAMLTFIDNTISRFNANNLAAVLTIQVDESKQTSSFFQNGYKQLWGALAGHFGTTNPEMVFLEVTNEPIFENNPSQWAPIQDQLIQTIRAGAPLHTILATGPDWSGIDGLESIKATTADNNVIYVFHFYESQTFTFQGADWDDLGSTYANLKEVPYPATVAGCQHAISLSKGATAKQWITDYMNEGWNSALIDSRIKEAYTWSQTNGVPVINNEFGCIDNAPRADRLQWYHDVRTSLEKYGIGWGLWSYDDYMGLDRKTSSDGTITLDWELANVLGLTQPGSTPTPTPTPTPEPSITPTPEPSITQHLTHR